MSASPLAPDAPSAAPEAPATPATPAAPEAPATPAAAPVLASSSTAVPPSPDPRDPGGPSASAGPAARPSVERPYPLATPLPAKGGTRRPPWVLMYHSVSEDTDDPYRITVTPHRLDRQLRWLRDRGLTGVGAGLLMRARAAGNAAGLVGLTFDDGYADFVANAVPLLSRYGFTATVFALPGRLGGENGWDELGPRKPLLDAEGLRAAANAGMEIGSHGLVHTDLTLADDATLERETAASRAVLTGITGTAPAGFCYPYGTVDARVVSAVRAAGYRYACAIDPGPLTCEHALPRVHIDAADTSVRLYLKRLLHPLRRKPLPPHPAPESTGPADSRDVADGRDGHDATEAASPRR
jgi:peptidoglycan/xylan/chitin deacetylase (PgdA/CDA1 family)